MPLSDAAVYQGYYYASPECWSVYTEVLGVEFGNAVLFGQVHQLTVDTYAVQHAGGPHPDKSVGIHLSGLHLVLERGRRPTSVPPLLQRLANAVRVWPHFPAPTEAGSLTVFEIALSDSIEEHIENVRAWAGGVWDAWSPYHAEVAALVSRHLTLDQVETTAGTLAETSRPAGREVPLTALGASHLGAHSARRFRGRRSRWGASSES